MPISPRQANQAKQHLDLAYVQATAANIDQAMRRWFDGARFQIEATLEGVNEQALFEQYEANGWKVERLSGNWVFTPKA